MRTTERTGPPARRSRCTPPKLSGEGPSALEEPVDDRLGLHRELTVPRAHAHAIILKEMPVPRCTALRRDGRECAALASSPTATYCRHHEGLAAELGEIAVRSGQTRVDATHVPSTRDDRGDDDDRDHERRGHPRPRFGLCSRRRLQPRRRRSKARCPTQRSRRRVRTGQRSPVQTVARSTGPRCMFPM